MTVSRNEVEIYFLDYGNTDLIPTSDVKVMAGGSRSWQGVSFNVHGRRLLYMAVK